MNNQLALSVILYVVCHKDIFIALTSMAQDQNRGGSIERVYCTNQTIEEVYEDH